ncbi:MAG: hypothetical protein JG781_2124 [Peptococcaceae bacterium]|nr:hypothetical protein [Peptococcaceae bacterium]
MANTFGVHAVFYYYELEHLMVNLCHYIHNAAVNREAVFLSLDPDLLKRLHYFLKVNGIPTEGVTSHSLNELLECLRRSGSKGVHEKICNLVSSVTSAGYQGIRWICQPFFFLEETPREEIYHFEKDLGEALIGTNCSFLCAYDFGVVVNSDARHIEFLQDSLLTHEMILNKFTLKKCDEVLKVK